MKSPDRKVHLIPFEKAQKIKVILSVNDEKCPAYLEYIDQEAERYGIQFSIILINDTSYPIPRHVVRKDLVLLNKGIDYNGTKLLSNVCDSFFSESCDICMVACNSYMEIAYYIAEMASASLKIGPEFKSKNPFDVSIRIKRKYEGESIVKDFERHLKEITRNSFSDGVLASTSA